MKPDRMVDMVRTQCAKGHESDYGQLDGLLTGGQIKMQRDGGQLLQVSNINIPNLSIIQAAIYCGNF